MNAGQKIFIVEDEPDIRKLVNYNLAQEHFQGAGSRRRRASAEDGPAGKARPGDSRSDVAGSSGMELCKILRERHETAKLPILMLTAKAGEADRVVGLEMGADDYLAKPFSPREMVARVRAILRRVESARQAEHPPAYDKGGLKIDFSTYEVFARGRTRQTDFKGI